MTDFNHGDILRFKDSDGYVTISENKDHLNNIEGLPIATFTVSKINNVVNFQVSMPDGTNVGWIPSNLKETNIPINKDYIDNKIGWRIEGNKNGFYLKHETNTWIGKDISLYQLKFQKDIAIKFVAENRWQ